MRRGRNNFCSLSTAGAALHESEFGTPLPCYEAGDRVRVQSYIHHAKVLGGPGEVVTQTPRALGPPAATQHSPIATGLPWTPGRITNGDDGSDGANRSPREASTAGANRYTLATPSWDCAFLHDMLALPRLTPATAG
jgi:hypothetical protein